MSAATTVAWGAASQAGTTHTANEDSTFADGSVFAIADGMGGHVGGATASSMATAALHGLGSPVPTSSVVVDAISGAHARILSEVGATGDLAGMGTTLAGLALVVEDGRELWLAFNIGDSRIYRLEREGLAQVSVDHSVVQELIDAGELTPAAAAQDERRHLVTRALGGSSQPEVDFWLLTPTAGERFLLCSDGLSGALPPDVLEEGLRRFSDPQAAAIQLVTAAAAAGARDDISAIVVHTLHSPSEHAIQETVTIERPQPGGGDTGPTPT